MFEQAYQINDGERHWVFATVAGMPLDANPFSAGDEVDATCLLSHTTCEGLFCAADCPPLWDGDGWCDGQCQGFN